MCASTSPVRAGSRWPGFAAESPSYVLELYGVLLQDAAAVPGAERLLGRLRAVGSRFVVATNDSVRSPAELSVLLTRAGLAVPAELVWTAALTAARFVVTQRPDGSAFAVGSPALTEALRQVGYRVSDSAPDYVLLGDGRSYSIEAVNRAVDLVAAGARFIATTAPTTRPNRRGAVSTAAAMGALISDATGVQPYVVGKPNPLLLRGALRVIGAHAAGTVLVGTRVDVDVVAGVEAGLDTVLVDAGGWAGLVDCRSAVLPARVVGSVTELVERIDDRTASGAGVPGGGR